MSAPEVRIDVAQSGEAGKDVDMDGDGTAEATGLDYDAIEEALGVLAKNGEGADETALAKNPPRISFIEHVVIDVVVGKGDPQTRLSAHEALLSQSPFFASQIAAFGPDDPRQVGLADEDIGAVGAFLEFLYTGEYYPRKMGDGQLEGESDGSAEDDGSELLRHARVYTLAEKLGAAELKALAHSKVHRVNSSAKGEIAYARYVYGHTARSDEAIRRPIASFWGQRSHVLRHEAEAEFRGLCIEFPEFGFDVLSHVLDARERKVRDRDAAQSTPQEPEPPRSVRKRVRQI